jgi:hypothetical protein
MAFGTPYSIGHNTAGTPATQTIVVGTGTTAGDAIIVLCGNSSAAGATISSVTDSKSNTYNPATTASVTVEFGHVWVALNTTALTTSDTITVTYSTTTGQKGCIAVGCSGVATSSAVDQNNSAHGSSTAPSVTSGTLAQATEMAIGVIFAASGSGVPTSPPLTQIVTFQSGSSPQITAYYQATASTTAVTCSGTITSANWCAQIITLLPAAAGGASATPAPLVVPSLAAIQASTW